MDAALGSVLITMHACAYMYACKRSANMLQIPESGACGSYSHLFLFFPSDQQSLASSCQLFLEKTPHFHFRMQHTTSLQYFYQWVKLNKFWISASHAHTHPHSARTRAHTDTCQGLFICAERVSVDSLYWERHAFESFKSQGPYNIEEHTGRKQY